MKRSPRDSASLSRKRASRAERLGPGARTLFRRPAFLAALGFLLYLLAWGRPAGVSTCLLSAPDSDYTLHAVPLRSWFFERLGAGEGLAFWNPFWMGGVPVVETVQAAVFYPPVWLHLVLPDVLAANLLQLGHLWGAAISMWALMRILGAGPWSAFLSGLVYAFSGFATLRTYAGHVNFLFAMTWAPLVAGALYRIVFDRRDGAFFWGSLAWALMLVCGNLQIPLMAAALFAVFALACAVAGRRQTGGIAWTGLGIAAAMGVAGGAMGAAQWLPARAYLPHTIRAANVASEYYSYLSVRPVHLLGLVFPRLFGPLGVGDTWLGWETLAPLGAPALAFAVAAVIYAFRNRIHRENPPGAVTVLATAGKPAAQERAQAPWIVPFFAAAFVVFAILSMGERTPFYAILKTLVPPFRSFRDPGRFLFGATFAGSILAGCGLSAILPMADDKRSVAGRAFLFAAGTLAIAYVLLFYPVGAESDHWKIWTGWRLDEAEGISMSPPFHRPKEGEAAGLWRAGRYRPMRHDTAKAVALLAAAGAAIAFLGRDRRRARFLAPALTLFVALDLLDYAAPFVRRTGPSEIRWTTETEGQLRELAGSQWRVSVARPQRDVNYVSYARVHCASAYEPVAPGRTVYLWHLDQGESPERPQPYQNLVWTTPYLDRWAVRWAWFHESTRVKSEGWVRRGALGDGAIYENPRALPRSRFVAGARWVGSPEEALQEIDRTSSNTRNVVLLQMPDGGKAPPSRSTTDSPDSEPIEIPIVEDSSTRVRLRGDFPTDGYAVLADVALEGWRAFVDGQPARIVLADGGMRAVAVPRGEHDILFEYAGTRAARLGRRVSLASAIVFLLWAGIRKLWNASRKTRRFGS